MIVANVHSNREEQILDFNHCNAAATFHLWKKKEKSFRVVYIIHLFSCKSLLKVWVKLWKYVSANLLLHRIHVFCKINIRIVPFYVGQILVKIWNTTLASFPITKMETEEKNTTPTFTNSWFQDARDTVSWHNFMQNTTFHGVKYIFEGGKWIRRYLWFTHNIYAKMFIYDKIDNSWILPTKGME